LLWMAVMTVLAPARFAVCQRRVTPLCTIRRHLTPSPTSVELCCTAMTLASSQHGSEPVDDLQPGVRMLGRGGVAEDERSVRATGAGNRRQPGGDGADAVLQPGEERDVNEPPTQPTKESGELHRTGLQ